MNQEINGWKIVSGYEVFVKNGKIMRGVIENHNGSEITAYPYRLMPDGSWSREIWHGSTRMEMKEMRQEKRKLGGCCF